MRKVNPRIEFLEREVKMLRTEIARLREPPEDYPFTACDNSCYVAKPRGMGTNGGCRCDENKLRAAVNWWRRYASFLRSTIEFTKYGDSVQQWDDTMAMLINGGHLPPESIKDTGQ